MGSAPSSQEDVDERQSTNGLIGDIFGTSAHGGTGSWTSAGAYFGDLMISATSEFPSVFGGGQEQDRTRASEESEPDLWRAAVEAQTAEEAQSIGTAILHLLLERQRFTTSEGRHVGRMEGFVRRFNEEDHNLRPLAAPLEPPKRRLSRGFRRLFNRKKSLSQSKSSSTKGDVNSVSSDLICVICQSAQRNIVLMDCWHLVACSTCAARLDRCPLCRAPIRDTHKIFV